MAMAWQHMQLARAKQSPQPARAWQTTQPARFHQIMRPLMQHRSMGLAALPTSYPELICEVQAAVKRALANGDRLLEIDFPVGGLTKVAGDDEGMLENNLQAKYLRQFLRMNEVSDEYPANLVRVCFGDEGEKSVAMNGGKGWDEIDAVEATFDTWPGPVDYLFEKDVMKMTGLSDMLGMKREGVCDRIAPSDAMFVMAYPSYSIDELVAVEEVYRTTAAGRPIIIWNGELDKVRFGYYPPFWSRKELSIVSKGLVPKTTTVFYLHNFKGSRPGVLYHSYGGPWQVFIRPPGGKALLVHEQEERPSGKEVAMEILPRAYTERMTG
eukprot:gnl/MRDRNA2_/MRDRNA2_65471_c0_seq1.p1 gnl/MRDRNA2_/MRDRNA2_65471_c0~~gnl/MRDRNA2_/MRDRNA2_65471_c0_seq1.p1  ORF type:complete len:364 (+),score=46.01 gnl/MRDRNA2_/MRDRNA2_65471_c0_seq1:120-1094(+)